MCSFFGDLSLHRAKFGISRCHRGFSSSSFVHCCMCSSSSPYSQMCYSSIYTALNLSFWSSISGCLCQLMLITQAFVCLLLGWTSTERWSCFCSGSFSQTAAHFPDDHRSFSIFGFVYSSHSEAKMSSYLLHAFLRYLIFLHHYERASGFLSCDSFP